MAIFLPGQDSWVRVWLPAQSPGEPECFFSLCRFHTPEFSMLPVSGPCSQALPSWTVVCAQSKGLSLDEESSGTQRRTRGQPPCLSEPLHRAEQAGRQRREAWPKQGWLQHTWALERRQAGQGERKEVVLGGEDIQSDHMHMIACEEEGKGQCWSKRW